jgi:hypothetical protein
MAIGEVGDRGGEVRHAVLETKIAARLWRL